MLRRSETRLWIRWQNIFQ
ncbi:unnamed protein product [Larinioides sclopetarius]|uniref:Uncharacterized protein n=1 Tax=Larinioides sclopetarius TaxID=280406 RepID=A0AAV1ZVB8_9ARAC